MAEQHADGDYGFSGREASDYAYKRLDTPDGFLMLGTYAVTAGLAAAGGERRAAETTASCPRSPW